MMNFSSSDGAMMHQPGMDADHPANHTMVVGSDCEMDEHNNSVGGRYDEEEENGAQRPYINRVVQSHLVDAKIDDMDENGGNGNHNNGQRNVKTSQDFVNTQ